MQNTFKLHLGHRHHVRNLLLFLRREHRVTVTTYFLSIVYWIEQMVNFLINVKVWKFSAGATWPPEHDYYRLPSWKLDFYTISYCAFLVDRPSDCFKCLSIFLYNMAKPNAVKDQKIRDQRMK